MQLVITLPTVLKARPLDSSFLRPDERVSVPSGRILDLESYSPDRNKHWRVVFRTPFQGWKTWFVYQNHVRLQTVPVVSSSSKRLNVPYKSQLDNRYNPSGSCNVTSIAMCLSYLGVQPSSVDQLEDELYRYMDRKGLNRLSPFDLATVVRDYGKKDYYTVWGTIDGCCDHIDKGFPCVIHGYFTSFGHIVVVVGYDSQGFIVHDPFGEWFSTGYRNDLSGAYLHYSYALIRRVCIPDGQFWVHHISS